MLVLVVEVDHVDVRLAQLDHVPPIRVARVDDLDAAARRGSREDVRRQQAARVGEADVLDRAVLEAAEVLVVP